MRNNSKQIERKDSGEGTTIDGLSVRVLGAMQQENEGLSHMKL